MKKKMISVIFKDGSTATFEHCLDVYETGDMLMVYFQYPNEHIMHCEYPYELVACVIEGEANTIVIE